MDKIISFVVNAFFKGLSLFFGVGLLLLIAVSTFWLVLFMPAMVGDYVSLKTGSVGIGATVWILLSFFTIGAFSAICEKYF